MGASLGIGEPGYFTNLPLLVISIFILERK